MQQQPQQQYFDQYNNNLNMQQQPQQYFDQSNMMNNN